MKETKAEKDARTVGFVVRDTDGDYWYRTSSRPDGVTSFHRHPRPKPEPHSEAMETLRLTRAVADRVNTAWRPTLVRVLRKRPVPAPDLVEAGRTADIHERSSARNEAALSDFLKAQRTVDPSRPVVLAMTLEEAQETLAALECVLSDPSPLDAVFARLEDALGAVPVDLPASTWTRNELRAIDAALNHTNPPRSEATARLRFLIAKALEG